jgi:peroxiredoxin
VGKRAPNFSYARLDRDGTLSLASLRGRVVVLNFWASWCLSCREEMPDLDRLQERIRSRGGVVLAVSVDENCSSYEDFLKIYPVRFPTVCEPTKNAQVSLDYGSVMIPETYVIDRQGNIARKIEGPQEWESPEMAKYFDAALASN